MHFNKAIFNWRSASMHVNGKNGGRLARNRPIRSFGCASLRNFKISNTPFRMSINIAQLSGNDELKPSISNLLTSLLQLRHFASLCKTNGCWLFIFFRRGGISCGCCFNHFRWQPIADHNEWPKPYTITRRFLFELVGVISLDRDYWKIINLSFCFAYLVLLKYTILLIITRYNI